MFDPDATRQSLCAHLQALTREQVTALLTRRRDLTVTPAPKNMLTLAKRLLQPGSMQGALALLTLPQLQAAEAVAALGDGCTPQQLAALLGVPEEDPALGAVLAELAGLALIWPHAGGLAGGHLSEVWHQPLGLGPGAGELFEGRSLPHLRRVAKTLGVPAGRTKAELVAALPQTRTSVLLQADLTAVVTGTPSAALLTLLDSVADPESRSGAWTWRFSQATVRRALDAGADPQELLAQLRDAAEGGRLPQPLAYLVDDVARRHGHVQVRAVGCCLCSDDEALLAEVLSTKSLKALKLVRLAPTVLAGGATSAETLAALRAAGYAPMGTHPDGSRAIELTPRRRSAPPPEDLEPDGLSLEYRLSDPEQLAKVLVKR